MPPAHRVCEQIPLAGIEPIPLRAMTSVSQRTASTEELYNLIQKTIEDRCRIVPQPKMSTYRSVLLASVLKHLSLNILSTEATNCFASSLLP